MGVERCVLFIFNNFTPVSQSLSGSSCIEIPGYRQGKWLFFFPPVTCNLVDRVRPAYTPASPQAVLLKGRGTLWRWWWWKGLLVRTFQGKGASLEFSQRAEKQTGFQKFFYLINHPGLPGTEKIPGTQDFQLQNWKSSGQTGMSLSPITISFNPLAIEEHCWMPIVCL